MFEYFYRDLAELTDQEVIAYQRSERVFEARLAASDSIEGSECCILPKLASLAVTPIIRTKTKPLDCRWQPYHLKTEC